MRYGGTPTVESVGRAGPPDGVEPTNPSPPRRRRTTWIGVGIALALVASAVAWIGVRATSKPAVSKGDVGSIIDQKVGKAVTDLKALPPAGVGVYSAVRPQLVVIQTENARNSSLGSGVCVNAQGQILTALHVVQDAPAHI